MANTGTDTVVCTAVASTRTAVQITATNLTD